MDTPRIDFTADNQGYYRVFVDGQHVSNHVQEREASQRAMNIKMENPDAEVYYDHDYRVDVAYDPGKCAEEPSESALDDDGGYPSESYSDSQ